MCRDHVCVLRDNPHHVPQNQHAKTKQNKTNRWSTNYAPLIPCTPQPTIPNTQNKTKQNKTHAHTNQPKTKHANHPEKVVDAATLLLRLDISSYDLVAALVSTHLLPTLLSLRGGKGLKPVSQ